MKVNRLIWVEQINITTVPRSGKSDQKSNTTLEYPSARGILEDTSEKSLEQELAAQLSHWPSADFRFSLQSIPDSTAERSRCGVLLYTFGHLPSLSNWSSAAPIRRRLRLRGPRQGQAGLVKESAQQRLAVTQRCSVAVGVRPQRGDQRLDIDMTSDQRIPHDTGEVAPVESTVRKITDSAHSSGDRQAVEDRPLVRGELTMMEPDVGPTGLASPRDDELMPVSLDVTELKQLRRRAVRDNLGSVITQPLGHRTAGTESQPGATQIVTGVRRRSAEAVHTVGEALEHPLPGKPGDRLSALPNGTRLGSSDQTPLASGDIRKIE